MKKFLALLILFIAIPAPAQAASVIDLTEGTHRQIDGKFFDDELSVLISPEGRLGKLVFTPPSGYRIWNIDAALIDDVTLMSQGYKLVSGAGGIGQDVAKRWLNRLKIVAGYDQINAIAYGNPSGYWIHRLDPHNESYYLSVSADRLTKFFGKQITSPTSYSNTNYFHLTTSQSQSFSDMRDAIQATAKYMDPLILENLQLRSVAIFNSTLKNEARTALSKDLGSNTFDILHKIRLAQGRFTISTRMQELPITVVNDFPNPANLTLSIMAMNGRIKTIDNLNVKLDGKSRAQVKIPVEVLTSGTSTLAVGIVNEKKVQMGDYVLYPLTLRTISPIATWLTTIAAVTLFVSAVIQSVRRIRRRER